MVMVYVPAGEFWMGSDRKRDKLASYLEPYEKLTLDAFWIDQTEVTNAMFARFISATGYQTTAELEDFSSYLDLQKRAWFWSGADWKHPNGPESNIDALGDHPVTQVSQLDAETYCQWAGRFLPSEAQWVKAARGTDSRVYPWGDALDSGELANFADKNLGLKNTVRGTAPGVKNIDDGYQYTAPVGSYPAGASPYGALDMTGNVSEWTTTCFDTPENARVRPQPGMKFCQTKGGSFLNPASGVRAAYNLERNPAPPGNPGSYLGFRCAALP
jgi:formylglycine-generating enzyme required for sulfatase activity